MPRTKQDNLTQIADGQSLSRFIHLHPSLCKGFVDRYCGTFFRGFDWPKGWEFGLWNLLF